MDLMSIVRTQGGSLGGTLRALRYRNFRLYWMALAVSLIGVSFQTVAQGWLVYRLTDSPLMLGVVGFLPGILAIPTTLVGGLLADSGSRRKLLITTQAAMALPPIALSLLIWQGTVTVWHVIAAASFLGVAASLDTPARMAMIPNLVGPDDLLNAQGLGSAVRQVSRIIGPALAGLMIAAFGEAICFLLNGLSYGAMIIALVLMDGDYFVAARARTEGSLARLREALSYTLHTPLLVALLMMLGAQGFLITPYFTLLPVFARDILDVGAAGLGWLNAVAGVGALLGAVYVANLKRGSRGRVVFIGSLMVSLSLVLFAWTRQIPLSLLALFVLGAGIVVINATCVATVLEIVPDEMRGRVNSLGVLIFLGAPYSGGLWAGYAAQKLNAGAALTIGAVVFLVSVAMILYLWPDIRRLK